ncbi:hypothetical protein FRC03_001858 [Tulasnella sp. 419]|nr:hypothetical protein FRC02_003967 [Tulasnella sp. 418]KAG8964374.1 hypothetical protein FRC03_001858 [Tulasnella sp. 419]
MSSSRSSRQVHFGQNSMALFPAANTSVSLARILCGNDCYSWDIRLPPTQIAPEQWGAFASNPPMQELTLVVKQLPWHITVKNPNGVTIGDVLSQVHRSLLIPVADPHRLQDHVLYEIQKNHKHNAHPGAPGAAYRPAGYLWIDTLGRETFFRGLSHSRSLLESRGYPSDACNVWTVDLVPRPVPAGY